MDCFFNNITLDGEAYGCTWRCAQRDKGNGEKMTERVCGSFRRGLFGNRDLSLEKGISGGDLFQQCFVVILCSAVEALVQLPKKRHNHLLDNVDHLTMDL